MKKILTLLFVLLLNGCSAPTPISTEDSRSLESSTPTIETPTDPIQTEAPESSVDPIPPAEQEDSFPVEAREGFVILKQITSNGGEDVVYAEMSECVQNASNYATLLEDGYVEFNFEGTRPYHPCETWEYHLQVQDQITGEKTVIYQDQYPKPTSFIPRAEAGGCVLSYMPKAWSPNDKKIIVERFAPTSCSIESAIYIYHTVSPEGGDFAELAFYDALFTNDYSHVVYTADSETSPNFCAPGGENNHGLILFQNIESGEQKVLMEEATTYYELGGLSTDNKTLSYKATKNTPDVRGCGQTEETSEERSLTLPL